MAVGFERPAPIPKKAEKPPDRMKCSLIDQPAKDHRAKEAARDDFHGLAD